MEECQGPAVGLIYMFRSRGLQTLGALNCVCLEVGAFRHSVPLLCMFRSRGLQTLGALTVYV